MNEFSSPSAGSPAADIFPSPPNFRQRILVVEDAEDLRQLNGEMLMDAGYAVELVEDGAAACAALQLHRYDLLLTDQFLPKLSGVELLKKILTARMTLPIIMVTEILPTWEFALHPCLQSVKMLRKPYTMDKLLGAVHSVLPQSAGALTEQTPAPDWQGRSAAERLRF